MDNHGCVVYQGDEGESFSRTCERMYNLMLMRDAPVRTVFEGVEYILGVNQKIPVAVQKPSFTTAVKGLPVGGG